MVPALSMSVAAKVAVSCVTWLVVCAAPLKLMTALVEKLVPVTVRTNARSPCVSLSGPSTVIVGRVPSYAGVVVFEL